MFFKGVMLKDPKKILVENGPNSQSSKRLEFRSIEEIEKFRVTVEDFVKEAIELEKSGQKPAKVGGEMPLLEELGVAFKKHPNFKKAFESLTPGRQRGYHIHFKDAKRSETRAARIEKHRPRIMKGLGLQDL